MPTEPAPREQRVAASMRQAKTAMELTKEYRGAAEQRMAEEYRRPVEEVAKVWYEGVCRSCHAANEGTARAARVVARRGRRQRTGTAALWGCGKLATICP